MKQNWCTFGEDDTNARLLANDVSANAVELNLNHNESYLDIAQEAGKILHKAKAVNKLCVALDVRKFDDSDDEDEDEDENSEREAQYAALLLLHWITTASHLEEFGLLGTISGARSIADDLAPWFLRSIINRRFFSFGPLRYLKLYNIAVPTKLFVELIRYFPLEHLMTYNCNFHTGEETMDPSDLTKVEHAFRSNTSLRKLELCWTPTNSECFNTIILSLRSHSGLRELTISCKYDHAAAFYQSAQNSICTFLSTASCPLRSVRFARMKWTLAAFSSVVGCIQASPMHIEEIGFADCYLSVNSFGLLRALFEGKNTVKRLYLGPEVWPWPREGEEMEKLVGTTSGLYEIHINECNLLGNVVKGLQMKTCMVHTADFGSRFYIDAICETMPYFSSLKHVSFEFSHARCKERLLKAFKHNSSIVTAAIEGTVLSEKDHLLLQSYQTRNAKAPKLLQESTKPGGPRFGIFPRLLLSTIDATETLHGSRRVVSTLLDCKERLGVLGTARRSSSVESSTVDHAANQNKRLKVESSSDE